MLANRSIPRCTVIPELGYPDIGQAIDWLCDAFGFTLRLRIADHRAQLNVGDGAVVLIEQPGGGAGDATSGAGGLAHSVMIRVENVDRHHERARQRGARILRPPSDYPYGERQYTAVDFVGRCWTFSQSIADVAPEDWGGTPGQLY
ncbi:MAG TPA: VOC family protein [Thermoanaerobaculia bacterium]|nr:VOC family protein [Thermoanaerobaculia bacterium]